MFIKLTAKALNIFLKEDTVILPSFLFGDLKGNYVGIKL
jgi:hypothetical protein